MLIEIDKLPTEIQHSIMHAMPVDIIYQGSVIATLTPKKQNEQKIANNAYDYFCGFDYPDSVADMEFELPKRSQVNRQAVDFD